MEPKITVVAKDGQANVKLGADIIILNDQTSATFQTRIVDEFIGYISELEEYSIVVYANEKRIEAYSGEVNYNIRPLAICELEYHPKLVLLKNVTIGSLPMYTKEMEAFLENLKDCLDSAGVELLKYLKDFKQSIVLDVIRQKDNKGNFINSIKRTVRGREEKADYVFPDKITFNIPMFNYDVHRVNIECETKFDFDLKENKVDMNWKIVNFDFSTILNDYSKSYIMDKIKDTPQKYWGVLNIIRQTDEWSKRINALSLSEKDK